MIATKDWPNKDDRKKFDTQFKKAESNCKIAIVVDMWLTGFDVPFLDTMLTPSLRLGRAFGPALRAVHLARTPSARFIDKPVQRHNLIQTISRVNRKFENRCNVRQIPYFRTHFTHRSSSSTHSLDMSIKHRYIDMSS